MWFCSRWIFVTRELDLCLWDELSWMNGLMLEPECAPGSSDTGQEGKFPQ